MSEKMFSELMCVVTIGLMLLFLWKLGDRK